MPVDYLLVFLSGLFAGVVLHALWAGIASRWKARQKTINDSDKVRKESAEKLRKARADKDAARRSGFRIIFDTIMTGSVIILVVWILYLVITG
jgi:mRNA-degrading endonuclease RelE of RelBE toxin-antitoxin system